MRVHYIERKIKAQFIVRCMRLFTHDPVKKNVSFFMGINAYDPGYTNQFFLFLLLHLSFIAFNSIWKLFMCCVEKAQRDEINK